jgi:hypothetical protein
MAVSKKRGRVPPAPACGRRSLSNSSSLAHSVRWPGWKPQGRKMLLVVAVVVPVHRPVGPVVLPHQTAGQRGLAHGDVLGQQRGAVEVARFAGGVVGGQQGFAQVHVGVLAAVGLHRQSGVASSAYRPCCGFPEALLQQVEGLAMPAWAPGSRPCARAHGPAARRPVRRRGWCRPARGPGRRASPAARHSRRWPGCGAPAGKSKACCSAWRCQSHPGRAAPPWPASPRSACC